jgi:cysteine-S-conjugate beta-lyase
MATDQPAAGDPRLPPAKRGDNAMFTTVHRRACEKWTHYPPDVLPAWVAEMDFAAPPPVVTAVREAVAGEQFGYPPHESTTGLGEAFAAWCARRYGVPVDPVRVHVVPDVLRGLVLALTEFGDEQAPVIVPTPCYPPFLRLAELTGRPVVEVALAGTGAARTFAYDAIAEAFGGGARTLLLCNPHNPTGRVWSEQELAAVAAIVNDNDGRVVTDEIHAPVVYTGYRHTPYAGVDGAARHTITVTSASKAFNIPGLNCAQLVTHNDRDEAAFQRVSPLRRYGASTLGMVANTACYRDGDAWLAAAVDYLDRSRRLLAQLVSDELPGVVFTPPQATYLAWLDCRATSFADDPAGFILDQARVAVSAGDAFGAAGGGHVRLNFATSHDQLGRIVTAIGAAARRGTPRAATASR